MSLDKGLCCNNYHDYDNDSIAIQHEYDLIQELIKEKPNSPILWVDVDFPINSHSLYINPYNPPKGFLSGDKLRWNRISSLGEIENCLKPQYIFNNSKSPMMTQGVLGNQYLINALRLLACQSKYIQSLLVSDKFSHCGIYTFKFFKAGKWRYVYIDDYIPCYSTGKVYFSRNINPNETFAMLLEKAYAKLHGCYEAIAYGMTHKVIQELTPGCHASFIRVDSLLQRTVCDEVWDILEESMNEHKLIGCGRYLPDPYSEQASIRQGITINNLYEVVDICIASAQPTTDLDGITVGFICVKNLQKNVGRFLGSWSYGHEYWTLYPEIGESLRYRTQDIQYKRGLGPHPNEMDKKSYYLESNNIHVENDILLNNDIDDLNIKRIFIAKPTKVIQPIVEDLYWIQIEDFVDIFNRLIIVTNESFELKFKSKRLLGTWNPGLSMNGSGGPPYMDENIYTMLSFESQSKLDKLSRKPFLMGPQVTLDTNPFGTDMKYKFHGGIDSDLKPYSIRKQSVLIMDSKSYKDLGGEKRDQNCDHNHRKGDDERDEDEYDDENENELEAQLQKEKSFQDDEKFHIHPHSSSNSHHHKSALYKSIAENKNLAYQRADEFLDATAATAIDYHDIITMPDIGSQPSINDLPFLSSSIQNKTTTNTNVSDKNQKIISNPKFYTNPHYVFTVSEHTNICITLYQMDYRWSRHRLISSYPIDNINNNISINNNNNSNNNDTRNRNYREELLQSCMKYDTAIGFIVVLLPAESQKSSIVSNNNSNITTHSSNDPLTYEIVGKSDYEEYSNLSSGNITLGPGIYAVIPYTHVPVLEITQFILHYHYIEGNVEVESTAAEIQFTNPLKTHSKRSSMTQSSKISSIYDSKMNGQEDRELDEEESEDKEDECNDQNKNDTDNNNLRYHMNASVITLASYPTIAIRTSSKSFMSPPILDRLKEWEYSEITYEGGIISLYDEIGYIAKNIVVMRKEMDEMKSTMRKLQDSAVRNQGSTEDFRQTPTSNRYSSPTGSSKFRTPRDKTRGAFIGSKLTS